MTEKITFMGIEIGTVCEMCQGSGHFDLASTAGIFRPCSVCDGKGIVGNAAFDALLMLASGLTRLLDDNLLDLKDIRENIAEFEQAVGYPICFESKNGLTWKPAGEDEES
jgi:hypothetical protein